MTPRNDPPKTASLTIRLAQEDKVTIEKAADRAGKTVTSFMVGTSLAAAERTNGDGAVTVPGRRVPAWFRNLCTEAESGGRSGYEDVGRRLAIGAVDEPPLRSTPAAWYLEVEKLKAACGRFEANRGAESAAAILDRQSDTVETIWAWFRDRYPNLMALVPARRRGPFVLGVVSAYEATDEFRL